MQFCSCFTNTTELALSGIDNQIGWLPFLQKILRTGDDLLFSYVPTVRVIARFGN
jgi:hypothetical protein